MGRIRDPMRLAWCAICIFMVFITADNVAMGYWFFAIAAAALAAYALYRATDRV